jgi:hypothetical protein
VGVGEEELVVGALVELGRAAVKALEGPSTVTVVAPPLSPNGVDESWLLCLERLPPTPPPTAAAIMMTAMTAERIQNVRRRRPQMLLGRVEGSSEA